jgi:flagellar biosynthesis/type III secretory pathway chaperone
MNRQMTTDSLIDSLLQALDGEAEHLRKVTDYLAELSRLILKRDEMGLKDLLEQARHETLVRNQSDTDRHRIVAAMAGAMGCPPSAVTLSMLAEAVPVRRQELQARRASLRRMVEELRNQHYSTSMLLGEMIRINRSLLASITGNAGNMTYGRSGSARWSGADNILNLRY